MEETFSLRRKCERGTQGGRAGPTEVQSWEGAGVSRATRLALGGEQVLKVADEAA